MQEYYGENIWAEHVHGYLKNIASKIETNSVFVIDDWRRLVESNYLENQGDFNIIKIYLEREGLKSTPSKSSSHYEGQIKPEDCHIVFKYDKKYSNFEEIIGLIQNAIK